MLISMTIFSSTDIRAVSYPEWRFALCCDEYWWGPAFHQDQPFEVLWLRDTPSLVFSWQAQVVLFFFSAS